MFFLRGLTLARLSVLLHYAGEFTPQKVKRKVLYLKGTKMLAIVPTGAIMTAVITTYGNDVESRLVDIRTGDTVETRYHDSITEAVNHVEHLVTKIEYDEM